MGTYPFKLDFKYKNLVHDPISFDMNQFDFNFTKFFPFKLDEIEYAPVISFAFPIIKRLDA